MVSANNVVGGAKTAAKWWCFFKKNVAVFFGVVFFFLFVLMVYWAATSKDRYTGRTKGKITKVDVEKETVTTSGSGSRGGSESRRMNNYTIEVCCPEVNADKSAGASAATDGAKMGEVKDGVAKTDGANMGEVAEPTKTSGQVVVATHTVKVERDSTTDKEYAAKFKVGNTVELVFDPGMSEGDLKKYKLKQFHAAAKAAYGIGAGISAVVVIISAITWWWYSYHCYLAAGLNAASSVMGSRSGGGSDAGIFDWIF